MGGSGEGIVTRIFDEYGIKDTDVKRASERIAGVTGEVLSPRYSDARGDYYLSADQSHSKFTVESNELEDEDGKYLLKPEYAEYPVLLFASDKLNGGHDTSPYLDELRDKLRPVEGLTFLRRQISQKPKPPELALEEELRILGESGS
jgi:hypothetical protein